MCDKNLRTTWSQVYKFKALTNSRLMCLYRNKLDYLVVNYFTNEPAYQYQGKQICTFYSRHDQSAALRTFKFRNDNVAISINTHLG